MRVPVDVRAAYDEGEGSRAAALRLGREEAAVEQFYRFLRLNDIDTMRVIAEECHCDLRDVHLTNEFETVARIRDTFRAGDPLTAQNHLSFLRREFYIVPPIPANIHYRSHDDLVRIREYQREKYLARRERETATVKSTVRHVRKGRTEIILARIARATRVYNGAG